MFELALFLVVRYEHQYLVDSFQSVLWYLAKNIDQRNSQHPHLNVRRGLGLHEMQCSNVCEARVRCRKYVFTTDVDKFGCHYHMPVQQRRHKAS